ncbi:MAG TPA: PqqD family protein [Candidatus Polarisedimenticolia bacterium]|nr:PqqD family protein [Candidatus Polarisedimenticolia bacterium]
MTQRGLGVTSILVPAPDIVARDIAGEHLLVPVRSGIAGIDCLYTADEVGSFVYARLDGRRDAAALARLVSEAYVVEEERALEDVLAFLGELCAAGLARPLESR